MLKDFLTKNGVKSQAKFVEYGYGQVEPNHLSAQRTGQIYAQLPAAASIDILEQGQFAKYNYKDGVVDFTGDGEWMLVFNEIKDYRGDMPDCMFALKKDDFSAIVYSPFGGSINGDPDIVNAKNKQSRFYNGVDADGQDHLQVGEKTYQYSKVTKASDIWEPYYNEDPYHIFDQPAPVMMPKGTSMVPRLLKTSVGDIFTTNTIDEETVELGDILTPKDKGILKKDTEGTAAMKWQVVKIYTMPDHQKGVKVMRIA